MTDQIDSAQDKRSFVHSIFFRSSAIVALTTIVVAAALTVDAIRLFDQIAVAGVNRQVDDLASSAVEALEKPLRFKVADKINEISLKTLESAGENATLALVLGGDGAILGQTGEDGDDSAALETLAGTALENGVPARADDGRLVAYPVLAGEDAPAIGVFAIAASYDGQRAMIAQNVKGILLFATGVFIAMMVLTVFLLHRTVGKPLSRLSETVTRVEEGDYDTPSGMDHRRDEIGEIARHTDSLCDVLRTGRAAEEERAETLKLQQSVVAEMGNALDLLAEGVLHHSIEMDFGTENELLRTNFNRAIGNLRQLVEEVTHNANAILGNADRMTGASDELSRRTETQAATLEQTAAALEELLHAVRSVADNTAQADQTVRNARDIALRNGDVMNSAVSAMGEIKSSSEQISQITSVIDDIAFQTNLLALNAGVEAARAGESGSGFAVVAAEVRGLAQQTAGAAQQIKTLTDSSGEQVQKGVKLVEAAGTALGEVLGEVNQIAEMMNDLAKGAGEQAQGLNEINAAVSELDRVTQQNASMAMDATSNARELGQSAGTLNGLVSRFATDGEAAGDTMAGAGPTQDTGEWDRADPDARAEDAA